jgi:hypothetical protein
MFSHLLSKLPVPRLSDWRYGRVTVALAMLGSYGPMGDQRLVCITDNRVGFGDFSGENVALKNEVLVPGWGVLIAGNDVDHAPAIIRSARKKIRAVLAKTKQPLEPEEIAEALDESFSEQLQIQIENKILRKHGFDGESFRNSGKQRCTPEIYARVWDKVDREKFSLSFIVYGFDQNRIGHIWLVDGEDAPKSYDSIGFWSIGKGASAALNTIAFYLSRDRQLASSIEDTVYVAFAAKFMAESSDVGPSTFAVILPPPSQDGFATVFTPPEIEKTRKLWEDAGVPRIGQSVSKAVKEIIDTSTNAMTARVASDTNKSTRSTSQT